MQLVCFLMALAPVCVWIGGTNRWMRGQSGGADSFLSPGWIKEKAHMQDLDERSGTGVDILGVAQIIPGASYTVMKSFSREWKVLHAFFGRPLDSYSVIVTKAYQSTSPATIYTKMRSNRAKSMCLPTVRIQRTDAYLDLADLEVSSIDVIDERKLAFLATDALSALVVPADLRSQVGVIVLPMPIAALVVRGEWAELFCWARFKFPWQTHWPGDCWINERAN